LVFRLRACEFHFRALDDVFFPEGKAANVLRGALWPAVAPLSGKSVQRPSGFADEPRAFVIRAAHLDGKRFSPGDSFSVHIYLFDTSPRWVNAIYGAFASWRETGLGPRRGRVETLNTCVTGEDIAIDLNQRIPARRALVQFKTPTEFKGAPDAGITFATLLSAATSRISILRRLHGEGPLDMDFRGVVRRAHMVQTIRSELAERKVERLSTRTGQTHRIGGVIGYVEYEGELSEFTPWLRAACWTGVGRHTVWGNGAIEASFD